MSFVETSWDDDPLSTRKRAQAASERLAAQQGQKKAFRRGLCPHQCAVRGVSSKALGRPYLPLPLREALQARSSEKEESLLIAECGWPSRVRLAEPCARQGEPDAQGG